MISPPVLTMVAATFRFFNPSTLRSAIEALTAKPRAEEIQVVGMAETVAT